MKFLKSISLFCLIICLLLIIISFFPLYTPKESVPVPQSSPMAVSESEASSEFSDLAASTGQITNPSLFENTIIQVPEPAAEDSHIYYLKVINHELFVYRSDTDEVYMPTDLTLDMLPANVQQEVISTKYFNDIGEVYAFLESYTS